MEHNDRQVKSNTFAAYMICMTLILVTLIGSVTFCYAIMNDKYVEVSSSWEISIVPIENLDNEPGEEL